MTFQAWRTMPILRRDKETHAGHAAALVAALALRAQGDDRRARAGAREPAAHGAHSRDRRGAEPGADEGKSAEPAADAAARRRYGDLRFAGDLRISRQPARRREAVSRGFCR